MSKSIFEQEQFKVWIAETKEFYGEANLKDVYDNLGNNPDVKLMTVNQHRRLVGRAYRLTKRMIESEETPLFDVFTALLYLLVCCDAHKYRLDHEKLAELIGIYDWMDKYGIHYPGFRKKNEPSNEKEGVYKPRREVKS